MKKKQRTTISTMINQPELHQQLNRIRSLKKLEEYRTACKEFLEFPDTSALIDVLTDEEDGNHDNGVEAYDEMKEDVTTALEMVERRIASLSKFVNRTKATPAKV